MLESLGDGLIVTDGSGRIAYFNAVARHILGSISLDTQQPERNASAHQAFAEILRGINQQVAAKSCSDDLAGCVCGALFDVAERRRVAIELRTFAIHNADNFVVGAAILIRHARSSHSRGATRREGRAHVVRNTPVEIGGKGGINSGGASHRFIE